ncbi:uncharacterized protein LOC112088102 [Eutrema salsugineum]|uniref:uncharacterized protein LOC112088102 n=1 Tax=Eutrema salsugineum TaxID=72664 RepID=UPI000CED2721|nr:uncharacterized protein LOC112088102 [Eutrema salsugineum]
MSIVEWHNVPEFEENLPPDEDVDGEDQREPPDVDSDGEDRREHREFDIEEALSQFCDEPPVMHNVYPDTEDDEEQQSARRRNNIRRGDGNLYLDKVFISGIAFKEAVLDYALKTGRNIKQTRWDKTKLRFCCNGKGCSWRVFCSLGSKNKWKISIFQAKHTCAPNGTCTMLKVPQIARLFIDKIREEPTYFMPMKIEEMIMQKWGISVTRAQCQHARNKALRWIDREYAEQFSRLRDYKTEIEVSNPGSSVEVDCITNEKGEHVFQRFYVCFDNLRRSWKEYCRPLIGVDGCFLKTIQKGELFVANGRDAENKIYPVAWAVKIKKDLDLGDGDGYVLVSDRQKGLINAVKRELPGIEHRMCVRHIYINLKKGHKGPDLKGLIWHLAWSYNEIDYKENLEKIRRYDVSLYSDLLKTKPETWCRAYYKLGPYCEDVENNSVESFNNSIGKAREKDLVPMLETIARLAMVRIAKRDVKASDHEGICTPYVSKYLAELHEKAKDCIVRPSTNKMYDSQIGGCTYRVSLGNRTCTYRRWENTGIPCEHAYGVMLKKGLEAQDFVCHWFRTSKWRSIYRDGLVPIRGAKFWPVGDEPRIVQPHIPDMPGRQKVTKADKKRKRGVNESPKKKKDKVLKRTMHCRICGKEGHNSRFHKKKPNQDFLGEASSSQVESSQGVLTQLRIEDVD